MDLYEIVRILTDQKKEIEEVDVKALCPRREESQFDLESKLAQVVIGVRRSGKSMLCLKVLIESGKKFGYVNFDDENLEDLTDRMELEIARFLEKVSENHLSDETKTKVRQMLREVGELESIGDACYNLARTMKRQRESAKDFTNHQHQKLVAIMTLCDEALEQMCTIMSGHRHEHNINETYRIENNINQMRLQLKNDNIRAVNDHEYDYAVGTIFTDLVNECEKLGDYVVNVVEARFRK